MIELNEKPRLTRAKSLEKAKIQLSSKHEQIMSRVKETEKTYKLKLDNLQNEIVAKLKEAAKQASEKGAILTWNDRKKIESEIKLQLKNPYLAALYDSLQTMIQTSGSCEPDIDQIYPFSISPGGCIELWGTCFGPSQGKILLEIKVDTIVEIDVIEWTGTYISGILNPILGDVPLREYYGKVWIQRGDGTTSNTWPIMYKPLLSYYCADWVKKLSGGVFGDSATSTFLRGKLLGDSDLTVTLVERFHSDDGWSELRSPMAGGQNMAQGWHIGVSSCDDACMTLKYYVLGPKGIYPPYFPELGDWVLYSTLY